MKLLKIKDGGEEYLELPIAFLVCTNKSKHISKNTSILKIPLVSSNPQDKIIKELVIST